MIKEFRQISLVTTEGRYLAAAIDLIISESKSEKTRDEVVGQLSELVKHGDYFYASEDALSDIEHLENQITTMAPPPSL